MEPKVLDVFKELFIKYGEYFNEFYLNINNKDSEFSLAHPELRETVKKLQVAFCDLPENLQKRLLELNFNIFISYASDPDLFNYREFVHKNGLIQSLYYLNARINNEVNLAKEFIKQDKWDKYRYLPTREFNSYNKLHHLYSDQIPMPENN